MLHWIFVWYYKKSEYEIIVLFECDVYDKFWSGTQYILIV